MKTIDETIEIIARRIGYLYYHRPLMYGGDAKGVDLLLFTLHSLWAEIVDRHEDLDSIRWKLAIESGCCAMGFPHFYASEHPEASEDEITAYVVACWRKISDQLGVPIKHAELAEEFRHLGEMT